MNLDTSTIAKFSVNNGENNLEYLHLTSLDIILARLSIPASLPLLVDEKEVYRLKMGDYELVPLLDKYLMQSSSAHKDVELRYSQSIDKLTIHRLDSFGILDRAGVVIRDKDFSIDMIYKKNHYSYQGKDISEVKDLVSELLDLSSSIRKVYNGLLDYQKK